jgi:RNA polymerase sigma factor (sigma-70 family)
MGSSDEELIALDKALDELERLNPRQAQMVESRFFAGLNVAETAGLLGVSESVIERDWRAAKAWLASKIRPDLE